jgi:uncharacterized protein (TIGR02996 family)
MKAPDPQLLVFLREIKDRPDDDVPRLVLGDWLQDHGDPRGEFVHLQVRRARLRETDPEADALYRRERELLRRHALDWLGPLADFASGWSFERGFVHLEVRGALTTWARPADLFGCDAIRWVEGVTMRSKQVTDLTMLRMTGLLAEVSRLDLSGAPLMSLSPILREETNVLRTLLLRNTFLTPGGIDLLAGAPTLAGLRWLDLSGNRLDDQQARVLAESPTLRNLTRLDVRDNAFGDAGREALVAAFGDRVVLR